MGARTFGTHADIELFILQTKVQESVTSHVPTSPTEFGRACALSQGMMLQLTETLERAPEPHCSREQARELLEALRTAYESLSFAERSLVKNMIGRVQHEHAMQEADEERECFESVS